MPWRGKWQTTPVFLHGESHGQSSLVGYGPWGRKESDMTEVTKHGHLLNIRHCAYASSGIYQCNSTATSEVGILLPLVYWWSNSNHFLECLLCAKCFKYILPFGIDLCSRIYTHFTDERSWIQEKLRKVPQNAQRYSSPWKVVLQADASSQTHSFPLQRHTTQCTQVHEIKEQDCLRFFWQLNTGVWFCLLYF